MVDIPLDPHGFFVGLAQRFYIANRRPSEAARCFVQAFQLREGHPGMCVQAARASALAGDSGKAPAGCKHAVEFGWDDASLLVDMHAFEPLRASEARSGLVRQIA